MSVSADLYSIGEVVESSSTTVVAQCIRSEQPGSRPYYNLPELGTWVCFRAKEGYITAYGREGEADPFLLNPVESITVPSSSFGIVCYSRISSLDPSRRPTALGIESEDEIMRNQPQVFELMTAEFTVALTSVSDGTGRLRHRLPAVPPRMHMFVYPCDLDMVRSLTQDFSYLRAAFAAAISSAIPAEDLVSATLRQAWCARDYDEPYLIEAGKALLATANVDYDLFRSIILKVR